MVWLAFIYLINISESNQYVHGDHKWSEMQFDWWVSEESASK